jgi:hypothetical protein
MILMAVRWNKTVAMGDLERRERAQSSAPEHVQWASSKRRL